MNRNSDHRLHVADLHVADPDLLLYAGGELDAGRTGQVRAHLECCSRCRERLAKFEITLADFSAAHREALSAELPPMESSRAILQERLAQATNEEFTPPGPLSRWFAGLNPRRAVAFSGLAAATCVLLAIWVHGPGRQSVPRTEVGRLEEPDFRLTPGATDPVTENDLCGSSAGTRVAAVPLSLKRKVFEEYGLAPRRTNDYEVDYLITPELGGATDIRNLWPEPYENTAWNAHVKDQLEDRLHRMVCHGEVDLGTAQHDISTDWIAAYRKYFHAEQPLSDRSALHLSSQRGSAPLT
jgi:hypothetical protein